MKINLKNYPLLINEVFRPLLVINDVRYLVLYGGSGSGKSYSLGQVFLYKLLTGKIKGLLVCRKTKVSLKNSCFALFKELISDMNMDKLFKINKTDFTITCKLNKAKILFSGLDDVEKLKSIVGVSHIWVEEASECSRSDILVLDTRLRGDDGFNKQIYLSFNPVSDTSFLKKDYTDKIEKALKTQANSLEAGVFYNDNDLLILKTTYVHNKYNDEAYIKMLENMKNIDEQYYNIYALGNWGALKGRIFKRVREIALDSDEYKNFNRSKARHGFDFGYSPDPAAYVHLYIDEAKKQILFEDCGYFFESTNEELTEILQETTQLNYNILRCDQSNPSAIKTLQKAGINAVGAPKLKDSIKAGISFLKNYELLFTENSKTLNFEAQNYLWQLDKDGEATNQPGDKHNHIFDATRYALYNDINNNHAKAGNKTLKSMF